MSLRRPLLMGVVNVTPDSFYDGGNYLDPARAVEKGLVLAEEGADLLDVGGESTRPGADPVSEEEEARRVLPVLEALASRVRVPISVDTTKAAVARRAFSAGASWLNDVSALRDDPEMVRAAVESKARVVLMHRQGSGSKTMQADPRYGDVVGEILSFFRERLEFFRSQGGDPDRVVVDPGLGFGKNLAHNLEILRNLSRFKSLGRPVLVGASRKSFIGRLLALRRDPSADPDRIEVDRLPPPEERLEGSLACALWAASRGADLLRVHDVAATRKTLTVWGELLRPGMPGR